MPNEHVSLIERFEYLVELEPSERTRELDALKITDAALAEQLQELFEFHDPSCEQLPSAVLGAIEFGKPEGPTTEQRPSNAQQLRELIRAFEWQESSRQLSFGKFKLRKCLSVSTLGATYRAYDEQLNREVAIVFAFRGIATQKQARANFLKTAQNLAEIFHPHLAAILEVHDGESGLAIVRQWIPGQDLACWAKRTPTLPLSYIAQIGIDIAAGLAELHARGVVHRDVKPANVIMHQSDRRAVLTDFGTVESAVNGELATTPVGSPGFIASEVLAGQKAVPSSDLYSLGVILHWLAAGTLPSWNVHESAQNAHADSRTSNLALEQFSKVIGALTSPEPDQRPKSALEVIHLLRPLTLQSSTVETADSALPERIVFYRNTSRRRWLTQATGLLSAAVTSAIAGRSLGSYLYGASSWNDPIHIPSRVADFECGWMFSPENQAHLAGLVDVEMASKQIRRDTDPVPQTCHLLYPSTSQQWGYVNLTPLDVTRTMDGTCLVMLKLAFDTAPGCGLVELHWSSTGAQGPYRRILKLRNRYAGYYEQNVMIGFDPRQLKGIAAIQFQIHLWSRESIDAELANYRVMLLSNHENDVLRFLNWREQK